MHGRRITKAELAGLIEMPRNELGIRGKKGEIRDYFKDWNMSSWEDGHAFDRLLELSLRDTLGGG